MFWFRIAIIIALTIDLTWGVAHIVAILLQITYGEEQQSMVNDPGLNGTIIAYVFLLTFQFSLVIFVLMGYIICYKVWRNRFQMDHKLRKLFIVWIASWAAALLGNLGVAVYCLVRGKDPEGQLGFMYEMFQKHAIDRKFVSTFERYQRDHQCCGIYSPEDWLLVTLRATPGGGTGAMMMGGAASMDYGIQQNPSTGKCFMLGAAFPMGCGPSLMKIVNHRLTMYSGLMIVQVALGIIAAVLAWYCFFYWLEKEVIVIPEDEVSNIIVIEPSDSDTSAGGRKPTLLLTGSHRYGSDYLRNASYRGGSSGLGHQSRYLRGGSSYLPRNDRYLGARESYLRPDRFDEVSRRRDSSIHSIATTRRDRFDDRDTIRGRSRNIDDDANPRPSYRKSKDKDRDRSKVALRDVINERMKERQKEREKKSETERKRSENRRRSRTYSKRGDIDEAAPTVLYKNPKRLDED